MEMVECPLGDEEEDKVDSHRWCEAVDVAASGFRDGQACMTRFLSIKTTKLYI
jgi:hypothetical protein